MLGLRARNPIIAGTNKTDSIVTLSESGGCCRRVLLGSKIGTDTTSGFVSREFRKIRRNHHKAAFSSQKRKSSFGAHGFELIEGFVSLGREKGDLPGSLPSSPFFEASQISCGTLKQVTGASVND